MKTVYSVCGMCGTRCPVAVGVENGEAVWIQGNPHSATGSTLCPRGIAALALEKDSERPQSPLMRVGARGGHKWRAVRWEEALDAVAGKLRAIRDQYGPESVMFSHRGGPFTDLYKAFARGLGTPNIYSHSVTCTRNVDQACASVLGLDRGRLVIDYRESKHIVLQSRNALEALNLAEVAGITAARANGCKVTVMDVRATVSAAKADTFFFVRPGTDYAMNLAVLHVLISEKLYDPHMLPYIDGFGELEERVRPCTPEWAETETGIKADRIVRLARELAEAAPRVLWYPGWFTARYADSFVTVRSAYLINALLGSIGARGGMPISLSPKETGKRLRPLSALYPNITKPMADKANWQQPGLLHRAFDAAVTGDPYPVRAYISMRHNILSSLPDPDTLRSKLDKLDLIVAITTTWSPTADYADIVLPLSPALSRESILASKLGLKPQFFRRQRAVQPRFDTRADWEILCGLLACAFGLDKLAFSRIEDIWNYQLEGTGLRHRGVRRNWLCAVSGACSALENPCGNHAAHAFRQDRGPRLLMGRIRTTPCRPYTAPERFAAPDQFRVIPGRAKIACRPKHDEQPPAVRTRAHQYVMDPHGTGPGSLALPVATALKCTATGPAGRLR